MYVFTPTHTSADLAVVALLLPSCGLLPDALLAPSGNAQFLPPPPPSPPKPPFPLPRKTAPRAAGDGAGNSRAELLRRAVVVNFAGVDVLVVAVVVRSAPADCGLLLLLLPRSMVRVVLDRLLLLLMMASFLFVPGTEEMSGDKRTAQPPAAAMLLSMLPGCSSVACFLLGRRLRWWRF